MYNLLPSIQLSGPECQALLSAIVDCDPALYTKIKAVANEYEKNEKTYKLIEEAIPYFEKKFNLYHTDVSGPILEGESYGIGDTVVPPNCMLFMYYDKNMDCSDIVIWNYVEKKFIK